MKTTNIKYDVSLREIKKIKKTLFYSAKKKEYKALFKNIEKYEDTSYLNMEEELNKDFEEIIKNSLKEVSFNSESLKKILSDLFENEVKDQTDFNKGKIKKDLDKFENEFNKSLFKFNTVELFDIYSLKNNVLTQIELHESKVKSDEYFDVKDYINEIESLIYNAILKIDEISKSLNVDEDQYVNNLKEHLINIYKIIFDSGKNKIRTIPEWAKGLIFISPWILGFCVFTLYPLIQTLVFSFAHVSPSTTGFDIQLIGFENYINMFTSDNDFMTAIRNYLIEMVIYVPCITVFSLIIAMLLNTKVKGTGFFRTIFFLPVIITSGPVMKILIDQGVTSMPGLDKIIDVDAINQKLPEFLQVGFSTIVDEFIMILWFCGIQILVFLTGLQKIDKGVYEAASIDGASKWERFWKVTLPAINPTIVINVVFTIVMQSIFALNPIILKIQSDMNDTASDRGYGYASAVAFTYFIIMILVLVIFVLIFKRKDKKVRKKGVKLWITK